VGLALLSAGIAGAAIDRPAAHEPPAGCAATRVHGEVVRAGPFTGSIVPDYDVVDGRLRLRVGGYRDRETGLSQKIPWFSRAGAPVGRRLRIRGTRLGPDTRHFTQNLRRAVNGGSRGRSVYPSIVTPPAEGCWRLRFSSGRATGRLTVLVMN
jgi:hypothetical protein